MNKLRCFVLLSTLFLLMGTATAQHHLTLSGVTVEEGREFMLSVALANTSPVSAVQFDLSVPQGIDYVDCTPLNRKTDHLVVVTPMNGKLRVMIYSQASSNLSGNSGSLLELKLRAAKIGNYPMSFSNVVLSNSNAEEVTATSAAGIIRVVSRTPKLLSVGSVNVSKGETFELPILLTNNTEVSALQFDLLLPATGLTYQSASLSNRKAGHELVVTPMSGKLRVMVYSGESKNLSESAGAVLFLTFKAQSTGSYPIALVGAILSNSDNQPLAVEAAGGTVVVKETSFTLAVIKGAGGTLKYGTQTLSAATNLTIPANTVPEFTFTPDNGYAIDSVKFNGKAIQPNGGKIQLPLLTKNSSLSVTFAQGKPLLTLSVGENGDLKSGVNLLPKSAILSVNSGTTRSFTVQPRSGYKVKEVKFDGVRITFSGNDFTTPVITKNATLSVSFEELPNKMIVSVSTPGTLQTLVGSNTQIMSLTVTGSINLTDLLFLATLPNLEMVDISGAVIVESDLYLATRSSTPTSNAANEIPANTFAGMSNLKNMELPSTLTKIGEGAFGGCDNLQNITIPQSVESIGAGVFSGCATLNEISFESSTPPVNMSLTALTGTSTALNIVVPNGAEETFKATPAITNSQAKIEEVVQPIYHQVTVTLSNGGSILYNNKQVKNGDKLLVEHNRTMVFTYTPESNYLLEYWKVNEESVTPIGSTVITPAVYADGSLDVRFKTSQSYKLGDSNEDGTVDVSDVVNVVNYILNVPIPKFHADASDINKDGKIDVADVVGIVNIILNPSGSSAATRSATNNNGTFSVEHGELSISGTSAAIAGFDFAYTGKLDATELLDAFSVTMYEKSGQQRVIAFTMGEGITHGNLFTGVSSVSDLLFVDANGSPIEMTSTIVPTDIDTAIQFASKVFASKGAVVIEGTAGLDYTIYTMDGLSVASGTITANRTAITLSEGIYIVRIGDKRVKVAVK